MKLLTPQQVQTIKQAEQANEVLRAKDREAAAERSRKALIKAEADFNATLARHRHLWALEEEQHIADLKKRRRELDELETRKAKALIPIEAYKEQAQTLLKEADLVLTAARNRENEAEELTNLLHDKLDELGQREQDIIKEEQRQALAKEGISEQQANIIAGGKRLNKEIIDFGLIRTKAEQDIYERKKALKLWERSLEAEAEKQQRQTQSLRDWEVRLADERATLDRTIKRLSPLKKP